LRTQSNETFNVRRATETDIPRILDLLEGVAEEGRWIATEPPVDRERRTSGLSATMRRGDAAIFAAEADGTIIGELGLYPGWPGVFDLAMLVEKSMRGKGVGSALMRQGIAWARMMRAHKLALEVFPWNDSAIALYEKFGFVREGYRRSHLRRLNGELWDVAAMGLLLQDPGGDGTPLYSTPDLTIRMARRDDFERLVQLWNALWPEHDPREDDAELKKVFDGTASSLPLVNIVAEKGAELVGFVLSGLRSHANGCDQTRPVGFIEGWYVLDAHRRGGIGKALIAAAEDWARQLGCREMASDALVGNKLSKIAHERLGYAVANECVDFRKALT
jgi:aminoglycoside 6'-N-acetyltransferase I